MDTSMIPLKRNTHILMIVTGTKERLTQDTLIKMGNIDKKEALIKSIQSKKTTNTGLLMISINIAQISRKNSGNEEIQASMIENNHSINGALTTSMIESTASMKKSFTDNKKSSLDNNVSSRSVQDRRPVLLMNKLSKL